MGIRVVPVNLHTVVLAAADVHSIFTWTNLAGFVEIYSEENASVLGNSRLGDSHSGGNDVIEILAGMPSQPSTPIPFMGQASQVDDSFLDVELNFVAAL